MPAVPNVRPSRNGLRFVNSWPDDGGEELTLHLYDPNTDPTQGDGVHLRLNVAHPEAPTPIQHNVDIDDTIRGFFRVDYSPKDPSALEPK